MMKTNTSNNYPLCCSKRTLATLLSAAFICTFAHAETPEPSESNTQSHGFSGPENIQRVISNYEKSSTEENLYLDAWHAWKQDLGEKHGFAFGIEYNTVYMTSEDNLPGSEDHAWGSIFRLSTAWDLYARDTGHTGTLMFIMEYADNYSGAVPSDYLGDSIGYVGISGINYNDDGFRLNTLYWDQKFNNGDAELYIGYLDISDYVDVFPLTSPWTDYSNYMFSIGSGALDLTGDGALGIVGATWLTDSIYVMAGMIDQQGDATKPFDGFDTFFNDQEYFKHIEFGWTGHSKEAWYLNNIHVTLWHSDEREEFDIKDGWGGVFSANYNVTDTWLAFLRAGFAEDAGSLLERSVSIGAGYTPQGFDYLGIGSQLGFGLNWGRPNDSLLGADLDDQYGFEGYFRWQVSKEVALTPTIQYLIDPALSPDNDNEIVAGIRLRAAL